MSDGETEHPLGGSLHGMACRNYQVAGLIQKGIDRGEVHLDTDMDIAADTLFGPMWYRLLLGPGPLDQKFAKKIVQQVLVGFSTRCKETS